MKWYVYILEGRRRYLYTGITNNLLRRIWLHKHKLGAKSLKNKLPLKLIHKECYPSKYLAARREKEIKGWRKEKKLNLVKGLP